jgi:hypothetical protein
MEQINNLRQRLNLIKDSHPNIYKLWSSYIDEKLVSIFTLITECTITLDKIENENLPDITQDNIFTLLMLLSFNNE